jgi:hypothetical protein
MTGMVRRFVPYVLCLLCGVATGFYAGRQRASLSVGTEYVREPVQTGRIERPEVVSVEAPVVPVLPVRVDTVYVDRVMYTREVTDTAAIIADYELRRQYEVPLFDDQYGKLDISIQTQYNRLEEISYSFVPLRTVEYREIRRVWQPFASVSFVTAGQFGAGGGLFYHHLGVEYQWVKSVRSGVADGHLIGLKWKF